LEGIFLPINFLFFNNLQGVSSVGLIADQDHTAFGFPDEDPFSDLYMRQDIFPQTHAVSLAE
jgi:hypothetical protein